MNSWTPNKMSDGPTFCIEDIVLKFKVIKSINDAKKPDYRFFLQIVFMPVNIHSISFYAHSNLSYKHHIYRLLRQNVYHRFHGNNKGKSVSIYQTKNKDHRTKNGEKCKLMICAEVLDIKYMDKSKEIKTRHQIDTNISYKWTVKEAQLKSIKNGTSKRAMVSDRFGTDYNWLRLSFSTTFVCHFPFI